MKNNKIILGIYINPWVWIIQNEEKNHNFEEIDFDIRSIVFYDKITNDVEICFQKQGFVIASFSDAFFDVDLASQKYSNVLSPEIAQSVIDFFNSFSYLLYDCQFKKGGVYSAKQFIELSDLWMWRNKEGLELVEIAVEQPGPILDQEKAVNFLEEMISPIVYMSIGKIDDRWKSRLKITIGLIQNVIDLLKRFQNEWSYLSMLNKAINYNLRGDFSTAHIICWSLTEKLIELEWIKYLKSLNDDSDREKRINSKRMDGLTSSSKYEASQRLEILELLDIIPLDLYKKATKVRRKRNDWIHSLKPITPQDYVHCYFVAKEFLSRRLDYELTHPGSFFFS